jgi:hypothetical protein
MIMTEAAIPEGEPPPMEIPMPEVEASIDLEFPAEISGEGERQDEMEEITSDDLSGMLPPPGEMPTDGFPLAPRSTIADRDSEEYTATDLLDDSSPTEPIALPGVFDDLPEPEIPRPAIEEILSSDGVDIVTLQDGRQLTGEVIDQYDDQVVLQLESGNIIRIPASRVESIMRGLR